MTDDALFTMMSVSLAALGALIAWMCTLLAVSNTDLSKKKDQTIVIVCVTLTIFVVVFVSTYVWVISID